MPRVSSRRHRRGRIAVRRASAILPMTLERNGSLT
jgi:hypothetical protein